MVEPIDNELAGLKPSARTPVVVMPGNLSPVTELAAAATAVTVEPVAGTAAPVETAVMMPLAEFGFAVVVMACKVKVPAAELEAILQALIARTIV